MYFDHTCCNLKNEARLPFCLQRYIKIYNIYKYINKCKQVWKQSTEISLCVSMGHSFSEEVAQSLLKAASSCSSGAEEHDFYLAGSGRNN